MFHIRSEKRVDTGAGKAGFLSQKNKSPQGRKKLGELLIRGGLLSQEQLNEALRIQKVTREPVGKILIRQGIVSAIHIYHKLAEQWCMKLGTASLTVAFSVAAFNVAPAHAETTTIKQTPVAAIVSQPAMKHASERSRLFGSSELRSDNITAFTKWTQMLERFEGQLSSRSSSPRVQMWKASLGDIRKQPQLEQIREVNGYINQVKYINDNKNWGKSDYWATPIEFFSRGGDCEDFAIAKYASLKALGMSDDNMRIAIVHDKIKNIPHAILIVYADDDIYVLDNQEKEIKRAADVDRYRPIFSINQSSWWLHKA